MAMSCSLDDLPDELLAAVVDVVDAVPNHGRPRMRDLCHLCLVSKRFRTLAQPRLYNTIYDVHCEDIRPLISTLIHRPDLARRVRELKLDSFEIRGEVLEGGWPYHSHFPAEVVTQYKQEFIAAVKGLRVSFEDRWEEDLQRGIQDAYNALLLCLTPKLQSLDLTVPQCFYAQDHMVHRVLNEMTSSELRTSEIHGFNDLREIRLEHGDTENGFSLRRLSSTFRLPKVESLTMFAWGEHSSLKEADDTGDWPERTAPIRHIDILWSDLPTSCVKDLLSFVKTLESFRYEAGGSTVGDTMYHLPDFNDALSLHSSSLTQLELRFEESFWFEFKEETSPPLGSLSSFNALKVLRLDAACLTGIPEDEDEDEESDEEGSSIDLIDLLPPNIETFTVFSPIPVGPIEQLLESASERFPSLRQIRIDDWATEEDYKYLQEMTDKVSIDVGLRGNVVLSRALPR